MENEKGMDQERLDAALEDTGSPDQNGGADDYQLDDVIMPEGLAECAPFDKAMFIEVMKKRGITIEQAKGLWEDYTKMSTDAYMKAQVAEEEKRLADERARHVENLNQKIEGASGYNLTPEEAQAEIDRIVSDPKHAYWDDRAPMAKRDVAIAYVNRLYQIVAGKETSIEGYLAKHHEEKKKHAKQIYGMSTGSGDVDNRSSSNDQRPSQSEEGMGGMPEARS
jgi:uncharacterized DUF497 family protein